MGLLDHLSDYISVTTRKKKRKVLQACSIKVKMDCDGCVRKVKNAVSDLKGVKSVEVDRKQSRVTVSGYVEPNEVLEQVHSTGKKAEFWPYVSHKLVAYPYVPEAYDKKAPSGFVKNVRETLPTPEEEKIMTLFSDENPNACTLM